MRLARHALDERSEFKKSRLATKNRIHLLNLLIAKY